MPKRVERFPVTFRVGLATSVTPVGTRPHPVVMDNVWLAPDDQGGGVEAMPGYANIFATGNSDELQCIAAGKSSDGDEMIALTGGTRAYGYIYSAGYVKQELKGSLTSNAVFGIVSIGYGGQTYFFFFNGVVQPFKATLEGSSTVTDIGLARLDMTGADATSGGGSGVAGVVKYFIAEMTATAEGALSEAFSEFDAKKDDSVVVGMEDAKVTAQSLDTLELRLYRTFANGAQPFFLDQLTGTTTTTYTDTTPDSDLLWLPFTHGDQPPVEIIPAVVHYNRVFGLGSESGKTNLSTLFWSDLKAPESWWVEANGNKLSVYEDDGDVGVALFRDPDGIGVLKENHAYKVSGREPDQFFVSELTVSDPSNRSFGTPSSKSFCAIPGGLFIYWNAGFYTYFGGSVRYVSEAIEDELRGIRGRDEHRVRCGYWPSRRQVWTAVPIRTDGNSQPTHTYIYDIDSRQIIGRRAAGFNDFLAVDIETGDEQWLGLSVAADGKVHNLNTGDDFDTATMATELEMSPFFGRSISEIKRFVAVGITFAPITDGTKTFNVKYKIDGETGDVTTVSFDQSQTGREMWYREVRIGYTGRQIVVSIANAADTAGRWKIYSIEYLVQHLGTSKGEFA